MTDQQSVAQKVGGNAKDAVLDIGSGAAKGAAQGAAVGGLAGAGAGAIKGIGVAAVRSKATRNVILGVLAVIGAGFVAIALVVLVLVSFVSTNLGSSNSEGTSASVEQSGVDLHHAKGVLEAASGTHVPWELALAVEHIEGAVDLDALSSALIDHGLGQVDQGLGAGTVYDTERSMRRMGTETYQEEEAEAERLRYTAALVTYGLEEDTADDVFTLALRWTLGQVSTCSAYTPPPEVSDETPTPTPTPEPSDTDAGDKEEPEEREPLTCYDGLVVDGEAVHPLGGPEFPVTSRFGPRDNQGTAASSYHLGIDFGAGCDTPIYAVMSGRVVFSGVAGGWGNLVTIKHDDGLQTRYAHMPYVAPDGSRGRAVSSGQQVEVGDLIGFVGQTGVSFGCHLHFEMLLNNVQVDPIPIMRHLGIDLGLGPVEGVE